MTYYLLIADDHQVVRDGLRDILRDEADMVVIAEAATGPEALNAAKRGGLDLIMLDITMPGFSGVRVLQSLREQQISTPVIFFSMHPADQYSSYLYEQGAQGFISKNAHAGEILTALRKVLSGKCYFPALRQRNSMPSGEASALDSLSKREYAVMKGIVQGIALTEIARNLGINAKTVGTYRTRLMTKLNVTTNAEVVALASRLGLLD